MEDEHEHWEDMLECDGISNEEQGFMKGWIDAYG